MQIPSYDTWLAGERATAAKLNKNIRDGGNFLKAVPFAWGYRNAALSLNNNAWTEITLDAEKMDNDGMFNVSTGAFVIVTPGLYYVDAGMRYGTADTTGYRGSRIRVNGADVDVTYAASTTGGGMTVRAATYVQCAAGDSITVGGIANMTSTPSLALSVANPYYCFLRARWVNA
jgi:hypothetical protein